MAFESVAGLVILIASVLTALGVIFRPLLKRLKSTLEWFEGFQRDWSGEEPAPGRDRVPGVMERLNRLDGELSSNGGNSTKDKVNRLFDAHTVLLDAFVEMGERLHAIESAIETKNDD